MSLNRAARWTVVVLTVSAAFACGDESEGKGDTSSDSDESAFLRDGSSSSERAPDSGLVSDGRDARVEAGEGGAASRSDASSPPSGAADGGRGRPDSRDGGATSARPDAAAPPDGSAPPPSGDGGIAQAELETLRQLCVDHINMYRATLNLPPYTRAPEHELCSDQGAKLDGDSGKAHGSAGMCRGLGAQNTCPGWGVGPRTGNATVAQALTKCLDMMWAEAEPPVPRAECKGDCFQMHGHYLNMSDMRTTKVACGFYQMANGKYWMNQNFGR
jgi:hypothetical protein